MFVTVWCIVEQYGESKYTKQTPFNVNDDKKLIDLIEKVDNNFDLNPDEISADKAYGTINNRSYLKDNNIKTNIAFYDNSSKEYGKFDVSKFTISEDLKSVVCPNQCYTDVVKMTRQGKELTFKFAKDDCCSCPLENNCFTESDIKKGLKGGLYRIIFNIMSPETNLAQTTCNVTLNDEFMMTIQTNGTDGNWFKQKLVKIELEEGIYELKFDFTKPSMQILWIEFKEV